MDAATLIDHSMCGGGKNIAHTVYCANNAHKVKRYGANYARAFCVQSLHIQGMDTEWFKTRLKEVKRSQTDLANAIGRDRTVVTKILSGQQQLKLDEIEPFARVLDVPAIEVLTRAGIRLTETPGSSSEAERSTPAKAPSEADLSNKIPIPPIGAMPRDVPVYGVAVGGDNADFQFNGQIVDYVRRPPALMAVPNAFAVYVVGTSMWPRYEDGDLVYVHPGRHARPGDDVVIEMCPTEEHGSGDCYVKRLLKRTPTAVVCQQYNPMRDDLRYDLDEIKNVYRIVPQAELMGV